MRHYLVSKNLAQYIFGKLIGDYVGPGRVFGGEGRASGKGGRGRLQTVPQVLHEAFVSPIQRVTQHMTITCF